MFEWDDGNLDHIAEHGVDQWEGEDAYDDRRRIPWPAHRGPAGQRRQGYIGRTGDGRLIAVFVEQQRGELRVVTARDANETEARAYRRAN